MGPLARASTLLLLIALVAVASLRMDDNAQIVVLKTFAVVLLAFLPGWLFLRFVIVRAESVWEEYVLNLHRLGIDRTEHLPKPPVNSIYYEEWANAQREASELDTQPNIYAQKFEAYYGKSTAHGVGDTARLTAETFFPVLLATAIFAAGWAAALHGSSVVALPDTPTTFDLLRIGFVGAYLFTLQMLVRRYFQADLKASAYVNSVVRVVCALAMVSVVDLAVLADNPPGQRVALAFVIGFFPLVGLQALQKMAALALRTVVPSLKNDYPLSDLDGLSLWYEARLLELGIEDMENLATANLVDVTLHSRVPVGRLVDWVDQAHLYLHLEPRESRGLRKRADTSGRRKLRQLGIRTATALEAAFAPSANHDGAARGLVSTENNRELLDALRWALNPKGSGPSVTESLLKTFQSDPNLKHIRYWKHDWTIAPRPESRTAPSGKDRAADHSGSNDVAAVNGQAAPVTARALSAAPSLRRLRLQAGLLALRLMAPLADSRRAA